MNDFLNTEFCNDNLKMLDQAWEATLMAMDIELDMALLGGLHCGHFGKSPPHVECFGPILLGPSSPKRGKEVHNVERKWAQTGWKIRNLEALISQGKERSHERQNIPRRRKRKVTAGSGHPKSRDP